MRGAFGCFRVIRGLAGFGWRTALAGLMLILPGAGTAQAFDYGRYQPADLDVLARRKPPLGLGADVHPLQSVRLDVTLAAQAEACPTRYLKWAMRKSGIAKQAVNDTPIRQCIKVKSAKGRLLPIYIQDALAAGLVKEVPQGAKMTLYANVVFFAAQGPGIVVNEFSTQPTTEAQKPTDLHSGVDLGVPAATGKK
jgi:hypothetical protein